MNAFQVTLLGTGTSGGVPLIGCQCAVCTSSDPRNQRLRSSAWLYFPKIQQHLLIDTSIDLRQQALRFRIPKVDAVLYTHPHADHLHGIDELRCYNYLQKTTLPLFGNQWTETELNTRFEYAFRYHGRENMPDLVFHRIETAWDSFLVFDSIPVIPIALQHGAQECVGYRLENFAYLTDFQSLPEASLGKLQQLDTLVLDCVRYRPHATHLHLEKSLGLVHRLKPRRTFLTHLSHDMDHETLSQELPPGVQVGYDGLVLYIPSRF